jgi:hypothetical protein
MRAALVLLPFRTVRQLGEPRARPRSRQAIPPGRITWALDRASHVVPGTTCLPRALAAAVLLKRMGYPAILHIGVARGSDRPVDAHAWVESRGNVITGGGDLERYAVLAPKLAGR